jgi:hypothetical protein
MIWQALIAGSRSKTFTGSEEPSMDQWNTAVPVTSAIVPALIHFQKTICLTGSRLRSVHATDIVKSTKISHRIVHHMLFHFSLELDIVNLELVAGTAETISTREETARKPLTRTIPQRQNPRHRIHDSSIGSNWSLLRSLRIKEIDNVNCDLDRKNGSVSKI